MNEISIRVYTDAKDFKHHKIFFGKTILWPWPLSTFEENLNEYQNWPFSETMEPFSGSIVSFRKALDRPFKLRGKC